MNIKKCDLCPKECKVNRQIGQKGFCQAGDKIEISWYGLHFGEEPAISGPSRLRRSRDGGSGTIFFCHCNLKCVFCQNWQISQANIEHKSCSVNEVVKIMFELEEKGAHNINFVSPTIWIFWLRQAITKAKKAGLKIPIVWNSNGYERVNSLRSLKGLVDIYLPDYKYDIEELGMKYSGVKNYPIVAREAILKMQRQVGDFVVGEDGIGQKGLVVRHLVLPSHIENSLRCLRFIRSISDNVCLSLMSQYNPVFKAKKFPEINRTLNKEEYEKILKEMKNLKFEKGWVQEFNQTAKCFTPDFRKASPFGKI